MACLAALVIWSEHCDAGAIQSAAAADPNAPTMFILAPNRTAGWQFTVNVTMQVTHLGLYDVNADGFQAGYPVGLWSEEGFLLTSAVVPVGAAAPYIDGFRYVEAEEPGALLTPGHTYTIGYFAAGLAPADEMIHFGGFHTVNPLINQLPGSVVTGIPEPDMYMPDTSFGFDHWMGPSFQFTVIPEPASAALLWAIALMRGGRKRRSESQRGQTRRSSHG
jgi:hypothetical protein